MLIDSIKYGLLAALAIALVTAAVTDFRHRTISNWLCGGIALAAPLFWWASEIPLWAHPMIETSVLAQLGVALATFAVLAVLFALRAMGGGDVKLLTALALWISPILFLNLLIIMALLGGILTIGFGAWHIMRRQRDKLAIPYGVAIAMAGLWVLGTSDLYLATAFAGGVG